MRKSKVFHLAIKHMTNPRINKIIIVCVALISVILVFIYLLSAHTNSRAEKSMDNINSSLYYKQIERMDATDSWKFIKQLSVNSDDVSQTDFHDLAHFIGSKLYEEHSSGAIALCDGSFSFGCFHGISEAWLLEYPDDIQSLTEACSNTYNKPTGPWASCIHGIGHGIVHYYSINDLNNSLKICEGLESSAQAFCADGVFMEYELNAPKTFYKSSDIQFPCDKDMYFADQCARNQAYVWDNRFELNISEVLSACTSFETDQMRNICMRTTGMIIVHKYPDDVEKIVESCNILENSDDVLSCLTGASVESVFSDIANWELISKQLCNSLPKEHIDQCLGEREKTIYEYKKK
jgi:hypothetical protein